MVSTKLADLMNIIYLGFSSEPDWPTALSSLENEGLASRRLRGVIPARYLLNQGHSVKTIVIQENSNLGQCLVDGSRNWLIIGKISHPDRLIYDALIHCVNNLIDQASSCGVEILVDFTDDLVACRDHRSPASLQLLRRAGRIVCASEFLAAKVHTYVDDASSVFVIPDPVEGSRIPGHATFDDSGLCRLIWFGHLSNINALMRWIKPLDALTGIQRFELEIVAGLSGRQAFELESIINSLSLNYMVHLSPWNGQRSVFSALRKSHIALLPVDMAGPKVAASNNRLTEALWAGCFAVASPIDSYQEFKTFAWLGEDMIDGLSWAFSHADQLAVSTNAAQEVILRRFSPMAVGEAWERVLLLPATACDSIS